MTSEQQPPQAPQQVEGPTPPKGHRNPGRRAVRAQQEACSRWVAYYSPLLRAIAQKKLKAELVKPAEEQDKERIKALEDACTFTPYVRSMPKVRHQRGMLRRLAKQFKADPPRVEQGTSMGPEQ